MSAPGTAPDLSPAVRVSGFLVGAVVGSALAASTADCTEPSAIRERLAPGGRPRPRPPQPGQRRASTALADSLLEELLAGGVDLHRLTRRWRDWYAVTEEAVEPLLATALDHLRDFDAPIDHLPRAGIAPMAAVLPAALASASPKSMVGGAFHVARLLDPAEEAGLAAVAVVVAAAALLEGRRDVMPDVLSVLRANDAPLVMIAAVRDVPRNPREVPMVPRSGATAVEALCWILWMVEYQPRGGEALTMMTLAGGIDPGIGAVLGAMLGARDGVVRWPAEWLAEAGEEVTLRTALASRLAGG